MNGAIEASKKGVKSIVSPTSHCYFDYSVEQIDLKKVYYFNPIPNEEMKDYIIGGECNMWSERAPQHLVDSKVFPRILAMAEVLWSKNEKNYSEFHQRVQSFYDILDNLGVDYGEEAKAIQFDIQRLKQSSNGQMKSKINLRPGGRGIDLYFSFDGEKYEKFEGSFEKGGEFTIYAKAMKCEFQLGEVEEFRVFDNLLLNKKYHLLHQPSPSYPGESLTNGMRAPKSNFRDNQWMGFIQSNMQFVFENDEKLKSLSVGCLNDPASWIFFPSKIELFDSENGQDFHKIDEINIEIDKELKKTDFQFDYNLDSKFLKVVAHPLSSIPEWHAGKGDKGWLFVDQLEARSI